MMFFWFILACASGFGAYKCWSFFVTFNAMAETPFFLTSLFGSAARVMYAVLGITCVVLTFNFLARSIAVSKAQDNASAAAKAAEEQKADAPEKPDQAPAKTTHMRAIEAVHVVGVTFRNEDGEGRQSILRKIKHSLPPFEVCAVPSLELGEYEGKPSIAVLINDVQVGYLPAELAEELAPVFDRVTAHSPLVIGGDYTTDGERKSYGMVIDLLIEEAADAET